MSKVLVVIDNNRLSYYRGRQFAFGASDTYKKIHGLLTKPRSGMGLKEDEFKFQMAYPKVQERERSGKPKNITETMVKPFRERLNKFISEYQPDLIIALGKAAGFGVNMDGSLSANRGILQPINYTYGAFNKDIKTIITYSIESTYSKPYFEGYIKTDFMLGKRYLTEGDKAFGTDLSKYEYVDKMDRVREIFNLLKDEEKYPVVAVDTETNSLTPELPKAKLLDVSLSWEEGQGVNIPLKHKETPFTDEQVTEIYGLLNKMVESSRYKVFHNGIFDIQFMYAKTGLRIARNCMDTMIMHYVLITEETGSVSRGLKQLTLQYTDMGDYAAPLVRFKKNYEKEHKEAFLKKYEELKGTDKAIKKSDYQSPVNEVDGGNFNYEWIPLDILYPYAAADTDATLRLYNIFKKLIGDNQSWHDLIYKFYPKLMDTLALVQHNGLHYSEKRVEELKTNYQKLIDKLEVKISNNELVQELEADRQADLDIYEKEMLKKPKDRDKAIIDKYHKLKGTKKDPLQKVRFNPKSSNDIKKLFYVYAGYELPFSKDYMTKKGQDSRITEDEWDIEYYSTDSTTMGYLADKYNDELINVVVEYKTMSKLLNDFIIKNSNLADNKDNIHSSFHMTGTVTSRLTATSPNLQQLRSYHGSDPHDFEYSNSVKSMFTSRFEGGVMLNCDFTSLEIYIAALIAQDHGMIQILLDGDDYHAMTARQAFHVPDDEELDPQLRQNAKKVNFGMLYSMSASGLADDLGETKEEAQRLMDAVLNSKPGLKLAIAQSEKQAKTKQYVETISGFRRRLSMVKGKDKAGASKALRQAFNARVQGSGAYCTNTAINMLRAMMLKFNMKSEIAVTVHDSILVDAHPDELDKIAYLVKYCMEHLPIQRLLEMDQQGYDVPDKFKLPNGKFRFPLRAELEVGRSYGEMVDYDENLVAKYKSPLDYANAVWEEKVINDKFSHEMITEEEKEAQLKELDKYKKEP